MKAKSITTQAVHTSTFKSKTARLRCSSTPAPLTFGNAVTFEPYNRRRKIASTSATWAAGLPAAVVAAPGGLFLGCLCVVAAPVLLPEAAVAAIVLGAGAAAGSTVGAVTALYVGEKTEHAWDRSEQNKCAERAQLRYFAGN